MDIDITAVMRSAIEELNSQLSEDEHLHYDKGISLIGANAALTSFDFITFVSIIEDLLDEEYDLDIQIVSDKTFSNHHSPFQNIETLEEYIKGLISEES